MINRNDATEIFRRLATLGWVFDADPRFPHVTQKEKRFRLYYKPNRIWVVQGSSLGLDRAKPLLREEGLNELSPAELEERVLRNHQRIR